MATFCELNFTIETFYLNNKVISWLGNLHIFSKFKNLSI